MASVVGNTRSPPVLTAISTQKIGSDQASSLAAHTAMLAERASRWVALTAFEYLLASRVTILSDQQRKKILVSSNFFEDLQPLLKQYPLSFVRRIAFKNFVLPFCQKVAPTVIQTTANKAIKAILIASVPGTPFPGSFVSKKLREQTTYFSVLLNALKRTAHATHITGSLADHIGKEMEYAQSSRYSTKRLYKKIAYKALDLGIDASQRVLLDQCNNTSWYIRLPGRFIVTTSMSCLRLSKRPVLWLTRSWLTSKVQDVSKHNLQSFINANSLAHPLVVPFINFANHVLSAYLQKVQSFPNRELAPPTGIDRTALKLCIQQQILLLGLCSSSSQDTLRYALGDSYMQRLLTEIQERFALDIAATKVNSMISILWQTLTQDHFLQGEFEQLLTSLNTGLVENEPDQSAFSKFQNTFNNFRLYMLTTEVYGRLNQAEQVIDRGLGWWSGWEGAKTAIANTAADWLGKPIKPALADRVIPVGQEISRKAIQKIVKFWTLPYNLRYGLHYMILFPWLK